MTEEAQPNEKFDKALFTTQDFSDTRTMDLTAIRGRATVCIARAETSTYTRDQLTAFINELDGPTIYDQLVEELGDPGLDK